MDSATQARLIDDLRDHDQLLDVLQPLAEDYHRVARLVDELAPADARLVLATRRQAYARLLDQVLRSADWLTDSAA